MIMHQGVTYFIKLDIAYYLSAFIHYCKRHPRSWKTAHRSLIFVKRHTHGARRSCRAKLSQCDTRTVDLFLSRHNLTVATRVQTTNSAKAGNLSAALFAVTLGIITRGVDSDNVINFDQSPICLSHFPKNVITEGERKYRLKQHESDMKATFTVIPFVSRCGFIRLVQVILGNCTDEASITLPVNNGFVVFTQAHENTRRATTKPSEPSAAAVSTTNHPAPPTSTAPRRQCNTSAQAEDPHKANSSAGASTNSSAAADPPIIKTTANTVFGTAEHYVSLAARCVSGYRCCYFAPSHPLSQRYGKVRAISDTSIAALAKVFAAYGRLALEQKSHLVGHTDEAGVYRRAFIECLNEECSKSRCKRGEKGRSTNSGSAYSKLFALFQSSSREPAKGAISVMVEIHKKTVSKLFEGRVLDVITNELTLLEKVLADIPLKLRTTMPSSDPNFTVPTQPGEFNNNSCSKLTRCILTRGSSSYSSLESITFAVTELANIISKSKNNNKHAVLILDQFSVHRSPRFLSVLESLDMSYIFIPSGMTSELQPLDLTYNDKLKFHIRDIIDSERRNAIHNGVNHFPASGQASSVAANNRRLQVTIEAMSKIPCVCPLEGFQQSMNNGYAYLSKVKRGSTECFCGKSCKSTCPSESPLPLSETALDKRKARKEEVERLIKATTMAQVMEDFFSAD